MFVVIFTNGPINEANGRFFKTEKPAKAFADSLTNNWKTVQLGKINVIEEAKRTVNWVKK